MSLGKEEIRIDSIDTFKDLVTKLTITYEVLANKKGVDLDNCHFLHLIDALTLLDIQAPWIDPDVLKEIRSFIYAGLQPWVDAEIVSKVKASDSFEYSYEKKKYPNLEKFNSWEEYQFSIFDALSKEKERAAIEESLLSEKSEKSNKQSKKQTKKETEASKTRCANAIRDQNKKEADEFSEKAEIFQEQKKKSNLKKQRRIEKSIHANKIRCAEEALAKKGIAAVPMGGGGAGGSSEEKEDE